MKKAIVRISIKHSYRSDLLVSLCCPDGATIELYKGTTDSNNDIIDLFFDDDAPQSIVGQAPVNPLSGSFKPVALLAAAIGKPFEGIWTLKVSDKSAQDTGTLVSWSLLLQ